MKSAWAKLPPARSTAAKWVCRVPALLYTQEPLSAQCAVMASKSTVRLVKLLVASAELSPLRHTIGKTLMASGDCHRLGNTLGTPVIHGDPESTLHPSAASTKGIYWLGKPTVFLCRMKARQELPKHLAALSALGWESTWKLRL